MSLLRVSCIFWALAATVGVGTVSGQNLQTIPLADLSLSSIRSAIWIEERSSVVLVDAIGGRVLEVELRESGAIVPRKAPPELSPIFIGKASNSFIQLVRDKRNGSLQEIHWFDRDLVRKGVTKVVPAKTVGGIPRTAVEDAVVGLFSWTLAGRGDTIFAYGLLDAGARLESQNPHKFGFFTYKLKSLESRAGIPKADLVETFAEFDYYRLGFPYLVAIGYEVYYLEMGVHPALKHYDAEQGGGPIYLDGLPEGSMSLPGINTMRSTSDLFGTLEGLEMPAGLYGDGGFLYLLHRRPDGSGVTEWTLTKLQPEPENRRVQDLGTVHLRTEAPHLNVLFTPRSVLVFEKSSVPEGSRAQNVMAVQVVPKFWVTDPGRSPLREK